MRRLPGSTRAGSLVPPACVRTRGTDAQFYPRPVQRRFRRPASPEVLGPRFRETLTISRGVPGDAASCIGDSWTFWKSIGGRAPHEVTAVDFFASTRRPAPGLRTGADPLPRSRGAGTTSRPISPGSACARHPRWCARRIFSRYRESNGREGQRRVDEGWLRELSPRSIRRTHRDGSRSFIASARKTWRRLCPRPSRP